jgi:glycosyltransferase involved in cell wall biosynthesis
MRILFIGDVGTISGFSQVSGNLLPRWQAAGWEIAALTIDYHGDPSPLHGRYRLYPAHLGGDVLGVGRVASVVAREQPDRIVILNDAHVVAAYLAELDPAWHPRVLAYVPVDGVGLFAGHVELLNTCGAVVAYTQTGLTELLAAGLDGPQTAVIPHGIDRDLFCPGPRVSARMAVGVPPGPFVVLLANRNQPRKALWLAMQAFARFVETTGADAHLIYHGAVSDHAGGPLAHWASVLGIRPRFHWNEHVTSSQGVAPAQLAQLYRAADVQITTTLGEGWGLTTMEGMACGTPQIIPAVGALAEWASPGALPVAVTPVLWPHAHGHSFGHVVDVAAAAEALAHLYASAQLREELAAAGLQLLAEDRFAWDTVAAQFDALLRAMPVEEVAHA